MTNFFDDNDDLRFYVDTFVDWSTLIDANRFGGGDFASEAEAKEVYRDILAMIGEFSASEIAPHAAELDREALALVDGEVVFPERLQGIFDQIRELELHGLCVPSDLGGMGCPFMLYMLSVELIARADVSVVAHHGFHGGIAMAMLMYSAREGSVTIDREAGTIVGTRWDDAIAEIVAGDAWGSMDLTEADAGSDLGALRTVGTLQEDGAWRVTGQKIFITSGHGKYHFVLARTEPASEGFGLDGLSLFLVRAWEDTPEGRVRTATVERVEEKLGHHASATVTVAFEDSPAELVGERGEGFKQMLLLMNNARIGVGFESLGLCEAAYRQALSYAQQRPSMGKTIDRHELIADMLDEMKTDIQGIRALAIEAAFQEELCQRRQLERDYLVDDGSPEAAALDREIRTLKSRSRHATPLIKFLAAEKAVEMARRNLQIHGGHGYMTEYGAEKLLRDAVVLPIYEGTTQIQALMATKDALLDVARDGKRFVRHLADTRWKSLFASDPLERRVARVRHTALTAERHLMMKVARGKLAGKSPAAWRDAFSSWDPKTDFAYALLHAENLARILSDVAICDALWRQARKHPERREVLERYVERAEPRCAALLHRIQTTGERLLGTLEADAPETTARAAK
jgi:hypothetical protein